MTRPDIPSVLLSLIDAAFGRVRSKLQPSTIGHATRFAAVDRLDVITQAVVNGEGAVPYLAELGLTPDGGPPEEMQTIIGLLEAVQTLAEWQIDQTSGVDARAVREFFVRIGILSPWKAPAEINFRDGNVAPEAQRIIRRLGRFQSSTYGGQMMVITPMLGGSAVITAISGTARVVTGMCPPQIRLDPARQIWNVQR